MTIDCPNAEACNGELTFRIYQDSDGDPGVPWGVRSWTDAECTEQTCACELAPAMWDRLTHDAIEASENQEPYGY